MLKLLEPIGIGTFAEVWRGDVGVPPLAALKISLQYIDADEVRREAYLYHSLVHLNHPHIVQVRSLLEYKHRFCITMELAECNLFDKMRHFRNSKQQFPLDQLISFTRDAAAALDYCHSYRIIHAGINPSDILLFNGKAKIADFGLSHWLDTQGKIVRARSVMKDYCMAPEMKEGHALPQSDQYALAATFAWLRFGYLTFLDKDTIIDLSDYPEPERKVLKKALAADPEQRFTNCIEFVSALRDSEKRKSDASVF